MLKTRELKIDGYECVVEGINESAGLHSFIAVHNTRLGPALGGTRIYPYTTREDALEDALRLSKGMTYKSALAEAGLGGGKSVIIADPSTQKTEELLLAFAEFVNSLQGLYVCAEDVGSSIEDMEIIKKKTNYVAALPSKHSSGDPSPFTAWGIYRGIQAVSQHLWNTQSLEGKTIAVQGLGNVGSKLTEILFWSGARLIISDINEKKTNLLAQKYEADIVAPEEFFETECDILSPCALGGILNKQTIPQLRCQGIAGGANNQLLTEEDGWLLLQRGILYAPDYVVNAGGLINAASEFDFDGYHPTVSRGKVANIFHTLLDIFETAKQENTTNNQIANELALRKLKNGTGKRSNELCFQ